MSVRLVLLGPPGAGKGTQSKLLEDKFGIPTVSTGDILRRAVHSGTALGRRAKSYMDRGELVPDDLITEIVEDRLKADDCRTGFLLDGFPRTIEQSKALDRMLRKLGAALDATVALIVPREELVRRLSGRRTCRECGTMYHVAFNPPQEPSICDRCGGRLYQRDDDREETICARLDVYERQTAPLVDYFRKRGSLREVDGLGAAEDVFDRILKQIRPAA